MQYRYVARKGDPKETMMRDVVFRDGEVTELPPDREWLAPKLDANPWFERVEDKPKDKAKK